MAAIITPFDKLDERSFSKLIKSQISGADLTLEFENIESSVCKVAEDCIEILTEELYEAICDGTASADKKLQTKAIDYLQRSMLHFTLYEHLIFLIARIKDDGVTMVKGDKETTVFKYIQDGLDNKLITTGWFWMDKLLQLMEKHVEKFELWKESEPRKEMQRIPIGKKDFARYVGVRDDYFIVVCRWIIREAWTDCVLSRIKEPKKTDAIVKAMCYEVMSRACSLLAFVQLPEPIRKDISNEMSKPNQDKAESHIRKRVGESFKSKATTYWTALDGELKKQELKDNPRARPIYTPPRISEDDPFAY